MTMLSLTGAKILTDHTNGNITGHPAAISRLLSDQLIHRNQSDGTLRITPDGFKARDAWIAEHGEPSSPVRSSGVLPKLPRIPHQALVMAAQRADQLVPGSGRTLTALYDAGYADRRPTLLHGRRMTWKEHGGSLYLTPAGRQYARQRGNIDVARRRIVLISG